MQDTILDFLGALRENNSLEWMHANKGWYQNAAQAFEELVQSLILRLGQADPAVAHLHAKELTFRLGRDTRFSHDKSPYTPAMRAHIGPAGKAPIPVGYFLFVSPGASFLGGGLFASMFTEATGRVRDYIGTHGPQLEAILSDPGFSAHFTLQGEKLKKVPRSYDSAHPQGEYLKYKSWFLEYPVNDAAFADREGFLNLAQERFLQMRPFNGFLNQALEGFQMPAR